MKLIFALLLYIPLLALACDDKEYGCTVALCVANPGGPSEFVQCQSCVDRLRADLRHGKGFPSCNNERYGIDPWERCAVVYKDFQKDISGGAQCGVTNPNLPQLGQFGVPNTKPGRHKVKRYFEEITNANGTNTRYWFK